MDKEVRTVEEFNRFVEISVLKEAITPKRHGRLVKAVLEKTHAEQDQVINALNRLRRMKAVQNLAYNPPGTYGLDEPEYVTDLEEIVKIAKRYYYISQLVKDGSILPLS